MSDWKLSYEDLEKRVLHLEKELALEKENELKFKTVFENSPEGIILMDARGTVTDWNRFIADRTGITREMAVGRKIWDLQFSILSDDWQKIYPVTFLEQVWQSLPESLSKEQIISKEGQYIGQDGSLVLTEDIIFSMELGKKKFLCIIQRDLTERRNAEIALKKSEEKLKLLNSTKDKFFSIIGHDLKSPFSTINGFSQLLKKSLKESDIVSSEKYVEAIISSAQHTNRLLNNLLTWARNELGMVSFNPADISLYKVAEDVTDLLNSSAKLKEIVIFNNISSAEMVFADENMLRTILQNLILNAIKYTKRSGRIDIDSRQTESTVIIYVSDNGTGIKSEVLENLFDKINLYTTKGTEEEGGTGLGLIICKEFVEKHAGKIGAESEYGKGSKFWFSLPGNINQ